MEQLNFNLPDDVLEQANSSKWTDGEGLPFSMITSIWEYGLISDDVYSKLILLNELFNREELTNAYINAKTYTLFREKYSGNIDLKGLGIYKQVSEGSIVKAVYAFEEAKLLHFVEKPSFQLAFTLNDL